MELLQDNQFSTPSGQVTDAVAKAFNVIHHVGRIMLLQEPYFQFFHL
jgi:hypothetical protein